MPIDRSAVHQAHAFSIYGGFTQPLDLEDDLKTRVQLLRDRRYQQPPQHTSRRDSAPRATPRVQRRPPSTPQCDEKPPSTSPSKTSPDRETEKSVIRRLTARPATAPARPATELDVLWQKLAFYGRVYDEGASLVQEDNKRRQMAWAGSPEVSRRSVSLARTSQAHVRNSMQRSSVLADREEALNQMLEERAEAEVLAEQRKMEEAQDRAWKLQQREFEKDADRTAEQQRLGEVVAAQKAARRGKPSSQGSDWRHELAAGRTELDAARQATQRASQDALDEQSARLKRMYGRDGGGKGGGSSARPPRSAGSAPTTPRAAKPSPRLQRRSGHVSDDATRAMVLATRGHEEDASRQAAEARIKLGLQKAPVRCALCEHTFSQLPGITYYAHIAQLRASWGDRAMVNSPRFKIVQNRYDTVKVCTFCFQFFEPRDESKKVAADAAAAALATRAAAKAQDDEDVLQKRRRGGGGPACMSVVRKDGYAAASRPSASVAPPEVAASDLESAVQACLRAAEADDARVAMARAVDGTLGSEQIGHALHLDRSSGKRR